MERAVYFDAWFPRQHCYHPSLPPRRLRMIEDLEAYRATSLVWSALGGGSISLPYLEQEDVALADDLARGEVVIEPLITHRIPYTEAADAFDLVVEHPERTLGMVLTWDGA